MISFILSVFGGVLVGSGLVLFVWGLFEREFLTLLIGIGLGIMGALIFIISLQV